MLTSSIYYDASTAYGSRSFASFLEVAVDRSIAVAGRPCCHHLEDSRTKISEFRKRILNHLTAPSRTGSQGSRETDGLPSQNGAALMEYPQTNAEFPDLSDGGTRRQSFEQAAAPPETGSSPFSWSGVVRPRLKEVAIRENGFVLALWGGIAVVIGALLPFIFHIQATVDGVPVPGESGIGTGDRFISLFFGLLLAGMALSTRYRPAFRRRIAISSLILSLLGFAGYFLFILVGVAGITLQTDFGPTQVSWYPSIGALDSIAGCAACAIAAIVMLRGSESSAGPEDI
jgi:hypothetical protein